MKKIVSAFVLLILCGIFNFCSAISEGQDNHGNLEPSQLVLGYISVESTPLEILNAYGQPSRIENGKWFYGQDFFIQFIGRDNTSINEVTTTGNNGIKTSSGVGVGMPENILPQIYGNPSSKKTVGVENKYWYYGYGRYNWVYLQFICQNGVIKKISLVHLD